MEFQGSPGLIGLGGKETDQARRGLGVVYLVVSVRWVPVKAKAMVEVAPWKVLSAVVGNAVVTLRLSVLAEVREVRLFRVLFAAMTGPLARTVVLVPAQV
ncbi:hypothetical protein [Paenarthrobacter sp. C1]|uniref:hypothetical protein n=1 Tax=Paenarthrobacter sp. C1 TaxID=3400220 RepID=UPI003BF5AD0A